MFMMTDKAKEYLRRVVSEHIVDEIRAMVMMRLAADDSWLYKDLIYMGFAKHVNDYIQKKNGIIITTDVPSAAINKEHLWINPDFWVRLTFFDKNFVIEHEITHLSSGMSWSKNWRWDPLLTNIALDFQINLELLKQPYGWGPHEVSDWLAMRVINYKTTKIMISSICTDVRVAKNLVNELKRLSEKNGFRTTPITYAFFSKIARRCGKERLVRYASDNFVLYDDIYYPRRTKEERGPATE